MSTRSTRRRNHKRLAAIRNLTTATELSAEATRMLLAWREEARRRADFLNAPAVWALVANENVREVVARLDPSGELMAELRRICAEAVAQAAGVHLVRGSTPVADRRRRTEDKGC